MNKPLRGFTIVELLIVIVVIAILAAITIVAYTAVSSKAKSSAGQDVTSNVSKKIHAYYTINGAYPTNCQLATNTTDASGTTTCTAGSTSAGIESKLNDSSILSYASASSGTGYNTTVSNNNRVIGYYLCGTNVGVNLFYIDFANSSAITTVKVGTGC
jgi:type IV pilus assembly protein PilA